MSATVAEILIDTLYQTPCTRSGAARSSAWSAVLDVFIDPAELPVMPHIKAEQIWRFGLAKVRESLIAMKGG